MTFQWPAEGTSVVLLPHGNQGTRVFELVEEWTRHHLLMPALYIRVEDQDSSAYRQFDDTGPVKVEALVAGRNGHQKVSLFDELARNEIKLVKVLACRLVDSSSSFNELQDQMVDRLRIQIERSAPLREEHGQKTIGTKILRLNLIAGESTKVGGSTKHLLELDWDANIILSPEDRATPSGFDTFTDSTSEHYSGFLLSNIASTVGLWTGVNKSVLELQNIENSTAFDKVMVQRTFGRIVKTDTLAIRLAAASLKKIETEGNPLIDPTYDLHDKKRIETSEIPSLINKMVEETIKADGSALSFNLDLEKAKALTTEKVSVKEGIKLFLRFFWEKIQSLPRQLIDLVFESFNRKATSVIFGEDSGYEIEARKDFRKLGLQKKEADDLIKLSDVKKMISSTLDGLPEAPDYRSRHPELWASIRKMMITSLEGNLDGELKEFSGKVLVDSEILIPKYGNTWSVPEFVIDPDEDPAEVKSTLEWLDVEIASNISGSIAADVEYLNNEIREYREELMLAESERNASKTNMKDIRKTHEKLSHRKKALELLMQGVNDE